MHPFIAAFEESLCLIKRVKRVRPLASDVNEILASAKTGNAVVIHSCVNNSETL